MLSGPARFRGNLSFSPGNIHSLDLRMEIGIKTNRKWKKKRKSVVLTAEAASEVIKNDLSLDVNVR